MRAKILSENEIQRVLGVAKPMQRVMVLLAFRAGLRSQEIATLDWAMLLDASGKLAAVIDLPAVASKGRSGAGRVNLTEDLREALRVLWLRRRMPKTGPVICGSDGEALTANATRFRMKTVFRKARLTGVTSHSGRRTLGTRLASDPTITLASVQAVLRHVRPSTTLLYVDAASDPAIAAAVERASQG